MQATTNRFVLSSLAAAVFFAAPVSAQVEQIAGAAEAAARHFWRGVKMIEGDRPESALVEFDRAATMAPESPVVRFFRANALAHLGRTREAAADIDRAIELRPDAAAPYYARGCLKAMAGDWSAAQADYRRHDVLSTKLRSTGGQRPGEFSRSVGRALDGMKAMVASKAAGRTQPRHEAPVEAIADEPPPPPRRKLTHYRVPRLEWDRPGCGW